MDFYQHPAAIVESPTIGKGTRIWAFAHILPGAVIGEDCNICDHTFIENDVRLGDRVTVKCGVQLWDGIVIEDDVFIGPNAAFTNDHFPRSKQYPEKFLKTVIHKGASIGANATILPGLEIGMWAMVGAGAVVTRNVPPYAVVVGNPARIIGYEPSVNASSSADAVAAPVGSVTLPVRGVQVVNLPLIHDLRGDLSFAQVQDQLPFVPRRYFLVFNVSSKEIRGEHAHRELHQFLTCVHGSCSVMVDDGTDRAEVHLDAPNKGLYIPPMIWGTQYKFSSDAMLLVLASAEYEADDYIRNYDAFIAEVKNSGSSADSGKGS